MESNKATNETGDAKMARAIKGGQVGANGEFYKGGQFLNTIEENAKRLGSRPRKVAKRNVAPYVWEVQPFEGAKAIFATTVGTGAVINDDGTISPYLRVFENGVMYNGETLENVQALCDRYNAGERWI